MTKQWHNTKVGRRPFNRFNPSLKERVASVYRPWFIVVALLCILVGIAIVGVSVAIKIYDSDISDEIFQIWSGIPLIFIGILALVPFINRSKTVVVVFLIFATIVMVVCACGSVIAGLRYWMDHWQQTRRALDDDRCNDNGATCVCPQNLVFNMPANVDSCDDLEIMVKLVISLIGLGAGGFVVSVMGIYLSMMAICCGPFMYAEWYDQQYDPDFNSGAPEMTRHTSSHAAYGNGGYH